MSRDRRGSRINLLLDFICYGTAQEDEAHSEGNPRWLVGFSTYVVLLRHVLWSSARKISNEAVCDTANFLAELLTEAESKETKGEESEVGAPNFLDVLKDVHLPCVKRRGLGAEMFLKV
ncbi:hypothetical protein ElyMa_000379900 [Elysia marginata]|uniref:Uncharacterized protein n=1 Tax=Elysia marginata TaxID=1093978 RepID=A0AAV4FHD0_9GAST|nr:hypothetical protein ElyMa_000379900 [Elysia marginata]